MIVKLFNNSPHIIYQTGDIDDAFPEIALHVSIDASGMICIGQEERSICITKATVADLCQLLKQLAKDTKS